MQAELESRASSGRRQNSAWVCCGGSDDRFHGFRVSLSVLCVADMWRAAQEWRRDNSGRPFVDVEKVWEVLRGGNSSNRKEADEGIPETQVQGERLG